jgi:hypothetical protein
LNDFLIPQRGVFAVGRPFLEHTSNAVLACQTAGAPPAACAETVGRV